MIVELISLSYSPSCIETAAVMMYGIPNRLRRKDKTRFCHDGKHRDDKNENPMLKNIFHACAIVPQK